MWITVININNISYINEIFLQKFSFGIGISANLLVGQYLGANEPLRAKNTTKVAYTLNCNFIDLKDLLIIF